MPCPDQQRQTCDPRRKNPSAKNADGRLRSRRPWLMLIRALPTKTETKTGANTMALIRSSILSDIRGSVGGSTYARNKSGAYVRNRTMPINPNTSRQADVRAALNNLAFIFNTLDRVTVNAWNEAASTYPAFNKLGEEYIQSGKQLFISCGLNLRAIGVTDTPDLPTAEPAIPQCDITGAVITSSEAANLMTALTISGVTSDLATAKIIVQATPNLPAARGQSYRNRMRQQGFATQGTAQNILAAWNATFATPAVSAGQVINFRVAATHPTNGLSSAWFYLRTEINEE